MKTYSGYTAKTAENLQLDAGAYFLNYEVGTDTFESAVAAGKLIGATRDGGTFSSVPSIRQIAVDGVKGRAKGLEALDTWDVNIQATVVELSKKVLKMAICTGVDGTGTDDYDVIEARNNIELSDYVENITWVGTLSGSDKPIIIQVYNALNTSGLSLNAKDSAEGTVQMQFYGHYDGADLNTPPFKIYYPKATA